MVVTGSNCSKKQRSNRKCFFIVADAQQTVGGIHLLLQKAQRWKWDWLMNRWDWEENEEIPLLTRQSEGNIHL